MKQTFKQFNQGFFNAKEIEWFSNTGVIKLNAKTNVIITLHAANVKDRFSGYKVQIKNKQNGLIDELYFGFGNYLSTRIDNRTDYAGPFIVDTGEWYIAIPTQGEIGLMVHDMFTYMDMWK
jgi:hypothetical protein